MVSPALRKSLPLLNVVSRMKKRKRNVILNEIAGEDILYNALREIAHNTLKGNVKLNNDQKRKLKPYNNTLKNLCIKHKCSKRRKKLVIQSGGFLPILIPAITGLISSLIGSNA